MFLIVSAIFSSAILLFITPFYSVYPESQGEAADDNIKITNIHTIPSLVIANSSTFRINATIINNSSNAIEFSGVCNPSLSITFEGNSSIPTHNVLEFCNSMHVRELKPGEMTSLLSGPYKVHVAGKVDAEVKFYYRLIHNSKGLISNHNDSGTAGPTRFEFTVQ